MNTVTCQRCDLVSLDTAGTCKRCGGHLAITMETQGPVTYADGTVFVPEGLEPMESRPPEASYHGSTIPRNEQRRLPYKTRAAKKKGLAVTSLVLGIIAMPPVSLIVGGLIVWVLAYVLGTAGYVIGVLLILLTIPGGIAAGIAAMVKANRMPKTYGGKGFAVAGISVSGVALLIVPLIAAIAIPNLLAARRAANEGSAVNAMHKIAAAQMTYVKDVGNGYCAEVPTLGALTLIDMETAKGERNGYLFYVTSLPGGGCEIHGVPRSSSDGDRSFFFSTTDKFLRAGVKDGQPAGPEDPLITNSTGKPPVRQSSIR
jgi:hypothetical protein